MVIGPAQDFWRGEDGVSLTEALLVLPIVLLTITAMVELGVAMFQWNQSVKAVQVGARLAAVSSPLVTDVAYARLTDDYGTIPGGDPTPATIVTEVCGAGASPCDSAALDRLLTGSNGDCTTTDPAEIVGMCDVAPFIRRENVRITYTRSGLGYVGRPFGPVTNITVELRDLTFDFFIFDAVIRAVTPGSNPPAIFTIPAHPVSITSEDVNDCIGPCP